MKIIYHAPGHHKNVEGIRLMCAAKGIELEITEDDERITRDDYDLLILNFRFIDPDLIPSRIKIIYGPQISIFPEGPVLGAQREDLIGRCVYNTISEWNKTIYEREFPPMIIPCQAFPFGVDTKKYAPDPTIPKTLDCIVYYKRRNPVLFNKVIEVVKKKGLSYKVFTYGSYVEQEFITAQNTARCMIVVGCHESQGFAYQEAMSRNIPLLVLDATSMFDEFNVYTHKPEYERYRGEKRLLATSVPAWSDNCGIRITSIDEFMDALDVMSSSILCEPRQFIQEHLNPETCIERILNYFWPPTKN